MGANFREQLAARSRGGGVRARRTRTRPASSVSFGLGGAQPALASQRRELKAMQEDIKLVVDVLRKYVEGVQERRTKWLEEAAQPVIQMMKSKAPVYQGGFYHTRYVYKGGKNKKRSPKGQGKIAATYLPGNLQGSIGIIPLQSNNVHIGPIFNKSGTTTGTFGEWRYDPYYFFFVEYGTRVSNYPRQPFLRPSAAALPQSLQIVVRHLMAYTKQFVSENQASINKAKL